MRVPKSSRWLLLALGLALAAGPATMTACVPTVSSPAEYAERPISIEAGAEYFLHTGGGDPYATGIAYPIFLALMEAYPNELGRDWNDFTEKFGMFPDPAKKGDPKAVPIGFHLTTDPNSGVPWLVANCQMCHAERIRLESGDVIVPGLGNKRVKPHNYVYALMRIAADSKLDSDRIEALATRRAAEWGVPWKESVRGPIAKVTVQGFKDRLAKVAQTYKQFEAPLPGRVATIESFAIALSAYRKTPVPLAPTIGWSKVPDIRSFPFRDTFSYDASGYGSPQALTLEADFVFGARPEWYLSHPHIATSMYLYLKSFTRHLPYPKAIDASLAARGKSAFDATCARCHGFYVDHGDEMRVSYRERVIPLAVIGTDPARVNAVTPEFVDASNELALSRGYTRVRNTGGYVPPVLLDVWARGLFGHAGQWPSIEVLATPPEARPQHVVIDTNGLYDLDRLGVRYEVVDVQGTHAPTRLEDGKRVVRPLKAGEYLYDGTRPGFGTQGHPFLASLPIDDRRAVIEYLKTL